MYEIKTEDVYEDFRRFPLRLWDTGLVSSAGPVLPHGEKVPL